MADKSFEQQVRNELADLRMKPADAVWPVVEAALQKERKRRWMIWLFLLAGCAGASFWGYYFFDKDKKETTNIPVQIQPLPKEVTKTIANEKNTALVTTQAQPQTEPVSTTPATSSTGPGRVNLKPGNVSPVKNISVKTQAKRDVAIDQETKKSVTAAAKNDSQAIADLKSTQKAIKDETTDNNVIKDTKKDIGNIPVQTQTVAITKDPAPVAKDEDKSSETLPPVIPVISGDAPPATINTKKNTWQWNIAVEAGASGLRKGLDFSVARDMAFATLGGLPSNGQPIGTGTEPGVNNAFSFGIQLQAKKQLGKKHALGFSAGYSLLQTSVKVGRKVDSAAAWNNSMGTSYSGFYYTTTDSTRYNNQYHFLRLGADLYTPFTLFKKIRFQWQLGAGVNILMGTNGLHYDPVAKKMFSDNSLYAKTQSYISTGIDLAIGKTPFLYIGPHWQYSFTNLTARPGGGQHLSLSTVKVSFVLPKKKK